MKLRDTSDEYRQIAPIYDAVLGRALMPIRREVCRISRRRQFRNIIDICCGTGQQCSMLSRLGFNVTGVDLSPSMLAVARGSSPPGIAYLREDATALSFKDNAFDCAILSFALHEKSPADRERIVEEALRVLAGGGSMILVDYIAPRGLPSMAAAILVNGIERMAGRSHHRNYRQFMRAGGLDSLVAHHRLRPVRVKTYHLGATGLMVVTRGA